MDRVFSFLLWPKREARGPWKQGRKKRESITCRTDRANEANKMFIIWLCWLFGFWEGDRELEVRTATYGPGIDQSQHAKSVSHIINYIILRILGILRKLQSDWSNDLLRENTVILLSKALKKGSSFRHNSFFLNNIYKPPCSVFRCSS